MGKEQKGGKVTLMPQEPDRLLTQSPGLRHCSTLPHHDIAIVQHGNIPRVSAYCKEIKFQVVREEAESWLGVSGGQRCCSQVMAVRKIRERESAGVPLERSSWAQKVRRAVTRDSHEPQ